MMNGKRGFDGPNSRRRGICQHVATIARPKTKKLWNFPFVPRYISEKGLPERPSPTGTSCHATTLTQFAVKSHGLCKDRPNERL